jgi:hypothetical protein
VLCQTSVYYSNITCTLLRKRLKKTSSSAKTARTVFEKEYKKLLEILEYINDYNYYTKTVDQEDQLKCYTPGLWLIRRERIAVNLSLVTKHSIS